MIRLFLIRLLETFFRTPVLYLIPAVLMGIYGVVNVIFEKPSYITSTVIYIRPNETIEQITQRQQNEENDYFTVAEITADELNALFQSEEFMNEVLDRINLDDPAFYISAMEDEQEFMAYLAENTLAFPASEYKVDIVVFNESPYLAFGIASEIFEVYLQRKIERNLNDSASTEAVISMLINRYQLRIEAIEAELQGYLEAHPLPETLGLERRDIESFQIERLTEALERAKDREIAAAQQIDSTDLIQFTTESVVRQSYLLLDAPYEPIKLTSRSAQLMSIIQFGVIGLAVGFILMTAVALFNRRIILPIDAVGATDQPVLALIVADPLLSQPTRWQRFWRLVWPNRNRKTFDKKRKPTPPLPPRWRRRPKTVSS
ncbi:MAG: hypothetical protein QNJ45_04135 [Ardenticatenaceae bacterium]|nr:hypothetical protein [Ardenticatenaceae bacterium]